MTEPALTSQQRAAVDATGGVVVRAGAGSGKTAVLVARYVRLLCGGGDAAAAPLEAEQILAVTFTEKAAAEMRDRIRAAIAARARTTADDVDRRRLLRIQRALASARIGTIHALAASVLRTAPLESGTAPGARVLDEIEGAAYVERVVRRALLASLRRGDADVRVCVDAWGFGREGDLVAIACESLGVLARRGVPVGALDVLLARHRDVAVAAGRDYRDEARRLLTALDRCMGNGSAKPSPATRAFADRWPEWRAALAALAADAAAGVDALVALRELASVARRAFGGRPEWQACADVVGCTLQDGTLRFKGPLPAAYGCAHGFPLAEAFTRVLGRVDEALAAAKQRGGVLTFDDLIARARRVLAEHPAVAARVTDGVRAILVDEFQDTDPAQVDLIRLLARNGAELFVVGDEKQSIYRFRGAEVQLFREMRGVLGRELALADNFRSRPSLLAFVNGLASRLFAASGDAVPWRVQWSAEQRLRACRPDAPPGASGAPSRPAVRLLSLAQQIGRGPAELLAAEARALEARVIAATISELLGEGWRRRDVAVLLPALTQVKAYEYALRRWAVPYEVVRGRGFYECQEVRDLVHLLAAVVDPENALALAGALRSPLFGLSDATLLRLADGPGGLCARFAAGEGFGDLPPDAAASSGAARDVVLALRAACGRVPAATLLAHAIAATDYEAVLLAQFHGEQKIANVRKLVARARARTAEGFPSAAAFVAEARRLLATEPREPEAPRLSDDADVVQVMTIHQAKGLEFPVVIVADLGREPPRDYRSPVVVDPEYGVLAHATFGAGRHRLPHRLIEAWRRDDRDRTAAEGARLLYVACTRARDLLILSEGKGRRAALAEADGGERSACEQIWSFLGRAAMTTFIDGADTRAVVSAPGEHADGAPAPVAVELEKSAAILARSAPPERDAVIDGLAGVVGAVPAADDACLVDAVATTPPAAVELVVTPTALVDFARCRRQFWLRHVRAVPERRGGASGVTTRGRGSDAAADVVSLGLAAHAALEVLDLATPAAERPAAVAAALAGARDLDERSRAAVARDLIAALARAEDLDGALRVVGREVPFCLPVPGRPALYVRGRIDVLAERDGRFVVRDYKYTGPSDDAEAHRVQLETYALAVATAHPSAAVDAEIEWLRAPGGRARVVIDLAAARARVATIGADLAAAVTRADGAAFPRVHDDPAPCRALGCGYVDRCFARTRP